MLSLVLTTPHAVRAQYTYQWQMGSEALGLTQLNGPLGVATDARGDVYVTDSFTASVFKYSAEGVFLGAFGSYGTGDGQFNHPSGMAFDAQGNLYVTDQGNNRVQKFAPDGRFLAKFGSGGTGDGQFSGPHSVVVDPQGILYVADGAGVQKFSAGGQFMLRFNHHLTGEQFYWAPRGVTLDAAGNVCITDGANHCVYRFAPDGKYISTFGGFGTMYPRHFQGPGGLTADKQGFLYIADQRNYRIQRISSDGKYADILIEGYSHGRAEGRLANPVGVALDGQGNVFVADAFNCRVQKFSPTGQFIWQAGAPVANGQFYFPLNVATDKQGNLYVADTYKYCIQKFSPEGQFLARIGSYGNGGGQFWQPSGVAVDALGNLYVADMTTSRILKFSPEGQFVRQWGEGGNTPGRFSYVSGLAVDHQNNLYVADQGNNRIQMFSPEGQFLLAFGSEGAGNGQFQRPVNIAIGHNGHVYVVDQGNNRIQEFSPGGEFIAAFGAKGSGEGQFVGIGNAGITVDASGNILVADPGGHRIQKFSPKGRFIAAFGTGGTGNGQFRAPTALAFDHRGNLFVADCNNHRIQNLGPAPEVAVKTGGTLIPDQTGRFSLTTSYGTDVDTTFIIDNTVGLLPLAVSNLAVPAGFTTIGDFPAGVAAGATATFRIRLPAAVVGTFSGEISFATNDADENPYNFTITGTVNKANQLITFPALSEKTFSDAPVVLAASASSGLPVAFRVYSGPATLTGNTLTIHGAGTVIVRAAQTGNENYHPAPEVDRSFTVRKAAQAIAFPAQQPKTYGDTTFTLSASASSALPVTLRITAGQGVLTDRVLKIIGTGTVQVTASQAGNANYNPAPEVAQQFTVKPGSATTPQTLRFDSIPDQVEGGLPFTLPATASSGLPVRFTVVSGPGAVNGNIVSLTGYGTVAIKAEQAGNETFLAAPPVTRKFYVFPAELVITQRGDTLVSNSSTGNQWLRNGEPIPGASDSMYVATIPGEYTVRVAGPQHSVRTAAPVTVNVTGIENPLSASISLFPNPAAKAFALRLPSHLTPDVVSLYSAAGTVVRQWRGSTPAGTYDVSSLRNGLYIVHIQLPNGVALKKLVISNGAE